MAFVKKQENVIPFRSGSDNEPGGKGELASALEDLFEIYESVVSDHDAASASVAKKKADDTVSAELLRNACLGMLTEKEKNVLRQRKKSRINSASPDNAVKSMTTSSSSTPSEANSA